MSLISKFTNRLSTRIGLVSIAVLSPPAFKRAYCMEVSATTAGLETPKSNALLKYNSLPLFQEVSPDLVTPAMEKVLADLKRDIAGNAFGKILLYQLNR